MDIMIEDVPVSIDKLSDGKWVACVNHAKLYIVVDECPGIKGRMGIKNLKSLNFSALPARIESPTDAITYYLYNLYSNVRQTGYALPVGE